MRFANSLNRRAVRYAGVVLLTLLVAYALHRVPPTLIHEILRGDLSAAAKIAHVKSYFESLGPIAPLVYLAFVTTEVVIAPLPGTLLYAPGGVVFGGFWGGLLSLAGNCLGAVLACQLARVFRSALFDYLTEHHKLLELQSHVARRGIMVIFLLRVNPLTSSDLVSYAAGLTEMPTWKLAAGTALGMAPLCWIQAYAADRMLTSFPSLLYPTLLACAAYAIVCCVILWRLMRQGHPLRGESKKHVSNK